MSPVKGVTTLLFDLGGVVFQLDFDRVLRCWARPAGCDLEQVRSRFHFDEAYERHELGELDSEEYFETLGSTLGISLSYVDFLTGWNDIYPDATQGIDTLLRDAGRHHDVEGTKLAGMQAIVVESIHDIRSTLWELGDQSNACEALHTPVNAPERPREPPRGR
jgi:hypothetical protein